jgi:hypothetical protein
MSDIQLRWLVRAALCSLALAAPAQDSASSAGATVAARPDPLDPNASVPALTFSSAFARYRGIGEDKPLPWREANDSVARIGGWRTYTRQAHESGAGEADQSSADTPAAGHPAKPSRQPGHMPPGHGGPSTR